ncbi:MAG: hypothetical protein H6Q17_2649 [Bacteroidetes bacterium]|jgi:hypothetical protein|nr:hypothetical protein [Bacteroidota bacterium]
MTVLMHHIYEYKKGLRNLVLHTMNAADRVQAERRLQHQHIDYLICPVSETKINIFFGAEACVAVVRHFGDKKLNRFTPEEDFILGIMLGYDRVRQCNRYLQRRQDAGYDLQAVS